MSTVVAICIDIPEFYNNMVLNEEYAKKFPGASWIPAFATLMKKEGFQVVTGDIALLKVKSGLWKASDVNVIQELDAIYGSELIRLGARSAVLTAFESPLFAYSFYDRLPEIAPVFPSRILFPGAFKSFRVTSGNNYPARFPNYNVEDIKTPIEWANRDLLVMVAANKHFDKPLRLSLVFNPRHSLVWLRNMLRKCISPTRRLVIKSELHTKRLEAIEFFGSRKKLKIFGAGWDETERLPREWQNRLKNILYELSPKTCINKIKTISGYKFALCFENVSYPGYITEKIIDCFVAGVVPIYLGAPDIKDYIPGEAFIDLRDFPSWEKLHKFLQEIDEEESAKIIAAGREYLCSDNGRLHSFRGFAEFMRNLIISLGDPNES